MHQTFLTIKICSYPDVLNDESHLIINWRWLLLVISIGNAPPKHYIRAAVVPCANTLRVRPGWLKHLRAVCKKFRS